MHKILAESARLSLASSTGSARSGPSSTGLADAVFRCRPYRPDFQGFGAIADRSTARVP